MSSTASVSKGPADSAFNPDEAFARRMDERDPLRVWREQFLIPAARAVGATGGDPNRPCLYFVGNSLGLQPKGVRAVVEQELDDWARLGVEAHLSGKHPWLPYHEELRETGARLVGAVPGEVVMMNSLTVNLHLLMVSFYRPTPERFKILVEDSLFPSDSYAVASQAAFHGFDPAEAVIRLRPREGEDVLRTADILEVIEREGASIALVMLGGVNYLTSQWFQMGPITAAGHRAGCVVGWDLAHGAGNVPLRLHDWGVDFAAWCSYKYLNAGPGAVAGAFVHEKHGGRKDLRRFAGWWGNDPATRFRMEPEFVPRAGADGWQLSNPPILSMAPLRVSLETFDKVGMGPLREKSVRLTRYLEYMLDRLGPEKVRVVTPRDPEQRGCALSVRVKAGGGEPRGVLERLKREGAVCDFRAPDVIRVAPVPLYNSFVDVWRFAEVLGRVLTA
jgi:kynureninase